MAAFNWIEFDAQCPVCGNPTVVRAQAHVGASFEGTHEGRFCQATYRVGDKLRWWSKNQPGYQLWTTEGQKNAAFPNVVRECCYASCMSQGDKLYAIIEFSDLLIQNIVEIGREDHWPSSYLE